MHCHNVKYDYLQISALKILNVPMLVSEQNPKSLGKTIPELDISGAKGPFAKMQFSMCTSEVCDMFLLLFSIQIILILDV